MTQNQDTDEAHIQKQLLVEYQIAQGITDHEVQTVYLTYAVFFPFLGTAAASLLAILVSGRLQHDELFLGLGVVGTFVTALLGFVWWRVADRRQEVRESMFTYQKEIASTLGSHMKKYQIINDLREKHLVPGLRARATFVNLMRFSIFPILALWLTVLIMGVLELPS